MTTEYRTKTIICPDAGACLFIIEQGHGLFFYEGMAEHHDHIGRHWAPCFSVCFFLSAEAAEQAARREIFLIRNGPEAGDRLQGAARREV